MHPEIKSHKDFWGRVDNQVPQTDGQVSVRLVEMYGKDMAQPVYGVYSIYRERDGLGVKDAWNNVLLFMVEKFSKKIEPGEQ